MAPRVGSFLVPPEGPVDPLGVRLRGSGRFDERRTWRLEGVDGDYEERDVRITGRLTGGGAKGQVEASRRTYNGQLEALGLASLEERCSFGPAEWEATPQRPRTLEDVARLPSGSQLRAVAGAPDEKSVWALTVPSELRPEYTLVQVDAESGGVSHSVTVKTDAHPSGGFAVQDEAAWVTVSGVITGGGISGSPGDCRIQKVDTDKGRLVASIPVCARDLAATGDRIWALEQIYEPTDGLASESTALVRLDAQGKEVRRVVRVSGATTALAVGNGSLWMATTEGLLRVDASTGTVVARYEKVRAETGQVGARDGGPTWVLDSDGTLWQVSQRGSLKALGTPGIGASGVLVAGASGAWVLTTRDATLYRLDDSGTIAEVVDLPEPQTDPVVVGQWVWVVRSGSVVRLRD